MKSQRGFTLIEMAIVLVIITILIGGLAMPLSAQIQARRIAETRQVLEEAREAIIGYAMSNTTPSSCACVFMADTTLDVAGSTCPVTSCPATGTTSLTLPIARHFLPCPDLMQTDPEAGRDNDGDGNMNDLNNGREDRYIEGPLIGTCSASSGNLPWVTLGAGAQDAWGNRLRYAVTPVFANQTTGFSNADTGTLQVPSVHRQRLFHSRCGRQCAGGTSVPWTEWLGCPQRQRHHTGRAKQCR
jgi:prepilin-type N-terminal cleavage/methylation domain-containing protein